MAEMVMARSGAATSPKRWMRWAGIGLSALSALGLLFSASMKLSHAPEMVKKFVDTFGFPSSTLTPIALTELFCVILYLVPRTSVLGAVLIAAYLGGAVAVHVRVGDPFMAPIALGVIAWLGLFLRDERLRALLPLRKTA